MPKNEYESAIMHDANGRAVVVISDVRFKGKRNINWNEVEEFIRSYIGQSFNVLESSDVIYVGKDFPDEFKGSEDTKTQRGANAKAKANATLKLPALIGVASNKRWQKNFKGKHSISAEKGWYRFTSRFALPVYAENGEIERFNIFRVEILVRHAADGKLYLYDLVNTKKETSTPPRP